ncbi:MAG: hypothetical protein KGH93_00900 [Patescibacteria group bacterium]|nr:hypothetical protein [Patescibacteria group bacterium]MDE1945738.1 hypothetical protein [Patescibacteria group bacterium]
MKKFEFNAFLVIALITLFSVSAYAAQFILSPGTTQAPATTTVPVFTRNLITGMQGSDVSALNAILDIEFNTTVPDQGTFTASTESYLIKLQQRYDLTPSGTVSGSDMIAKLNALAQAYNITLAQFPVSTGPSVPQVFTQDLSLGSVSDQVTLLKTVLNSDPDTALAYTTAPSNVFDAATQAAVIKFQNKYASIILIPNGLSQGTGSVGAATRDKLNRIIAAMNLGTVAQTGTSSSVSTTYTPAGTTQAGASCTSDTWTCSDWSSCTPYVKTTTTTPPPVTISRPSGLSCTPGTSGTAGGCYVDCYGFGGQPSVFNESGEQVSKASVSSDGFGGWLVNPNGITNGTYFIESGSQSVTHSFSYGSACFTPPVQSQPITQTATITPTTQTRTCTIATVCSAPGANHTLNLPTSQACPATPNPSSNGANAGQPSSSACNPANLTTLQRAGIVAPPAGCSIQPSTSGGSASGGCNALEVVSGICVAQAVVSGVGSVVGGVVNAVGSAIGGVVNFIGGLF